MEKIHWRLSRDMKSWLSTRRPKIRSRLWSFLRHSHKRMVPTANLNFLLGSQFPVQAFFTMEHHRLIGAAYETRWAYRCVRPRRSDGTSRGWWMPLEFDCRDISSDQLAHCGNVESNYRKFWRWWWHMAASLGEPSILTVGPIIVSHSQLGVLECLIIIAQSLLGTSPTQRYWIYIQ